MRRAAIYVRVSTDEQAAATSPSTQETAILLPLSSSPPIRHASGMVKEVDLDGRGTP